MSTTGDKGLAVKTNDSDGFKITKKDGAMIFWTSMAWVVIIAIGFFLYMQSYLTSPPFPFSENPEEQSQSFREQGNSLDASSVGEDSKTGNPKKTRQQKNNEREEVRKTDLAAQQGMWRATNVVAVVAFFQLIATFIGLLWIYQTLQGTRTALKHTGKTLKQTRIATRHAREATVAANRTADAAENADRAYVLVEVDCAYGGGIKTEDPDMDKFFNGAFFMANVRVENYGRTPAFNVTCHLLLDKSGRNRDPKPNQQIINEGEQAAVHVLSDKPFPAHIFEQLSVFNYFGPSLDTQTAVGRPEYAVIHAYVEFDDAFLKRKFVQTATTLTPVAKAGAFPEDIMMDRWRGYVEELRAGETEESIEMTLMPETWKANVRVSAKTFEINTTVVGQGDCN